MRNMTWRTAALMAFALTLTAGAAYAQKPCNAPNIGGTVRLPPPCRYLSPQDVHEIIVNAAAGTKIILGPEHTDFFCRQGVCNFPGGTLGGEIEQFGSVVIFKATGVSNDPNSPLNGWSRIISVPLSVETHTAPRQVGAPIQNFATDMYRIQGSISNDPDFGRLEIVGGTANGFPSPGMTTLKRISESLFEVHSAFNVNFEIRFVGTPDGVLEGASGSTRGAVEMKAFGF